MIGLLRRHLNRSARPLLVWCLLVAVPVYGLSGTLVELLGARHVHAAAVTASAAPDTGPMAGWQDFRRKVESHGAAVGHRHSHDAAERHHHAHDDATVLALDGPASDEAGSTTGAAANVLAMSHFASLAVPALPRAHWPRTASTAVLPWIPEGLRRPPKA